MVGVAGWQNSLARDVSFLAYRDIFTTVYIKKEVPVGAGTSFGTLFLAVAFRVSLQAAGCFEFFDSIGLLPGEVGVFAAEVTVGCRLFVDGATQV